VIAGAVGLALIGLLGYQVVTRWGSTPASSPDKPAIVPSRPSDPPISAAVPPMTGRIDLLVVSSKDGKRTRLRLADRGSVPVRADDQIRIESRLARPAYLYLFWIGSEGKLAPLFPWKDQMWFSRPPEERKVTGAELPEMVVDTLEIPHSPPGLETLVLLAREDSPLSREDEARLAQGVDCAPIPMPSGMNKAIWLEDGQEVVFRPTHGPENDERGIPSPKTRRNEDPVLRIRAIVSERVLPLGSYSQAVLFPNQGGQ
jgi:hypothetical protein